MCEQLNLSCNTNVRWCRQTAVDIMLIIGTSPSGLLAGFQRTSKLHLRTSASPNFATAV
eukprot:COSAG06_NODE_1408_length_9549_cov_12.628677_12_plen_59_part_00